MKTKKNPSKKTFPLSSLLAISTIILGILTLFLYTRVKSLNAETHTWIQKHQACETSMAKLSDCSGELHKTKEYQVELEAKKDIAEQNVDSLQNKISIIEKQLKEQIIRAKRPQKYNDGNKQISSQRGEALQNPEIENLYNQKIMNDLLRKSLR